MHRRTMIYLLIALFVVEIIFPTILYLNRNRLIFLPTTDLSPEEGLQWAQGEAQIDLVHVTRGDGRRLAAYDARPPMGDPGDPVVLFLHGNGGNIAWRVPILEDFTVATGLRTLLLDYSDYGGNPGTPSEKEVILDGLAAYDHLVAEGIPAEQIVLYGESLGGAVALAVAEKRPCAGVAVQSTFSSLSSMARQVYPWMPLAAVLTRGDFPSAARAARLEAPLLIIHGDRDRIVPLEEGKRLSKAAPNAELIVVEGADHNDLIEVGGASFLHDLGDCFRAWVEALHSKNS